MGKIKDTKSNIRLMKKFWVNKVSEENIVLMDLKLYRLLSKKADSSTHIYNLIDDYKYINGYNFEHPKKKC